MIPPRLDHHICFPSAQSHTVSSYFFPTKLPQELCFPGSKHPINGDAIARRSDRVSDFVQPSLASSSSNAAGPGDPLDQGARDGLSFPASVGRPSLDPAVVLAQNPGIRLRPIQKHWVQRFLGNAVVHVLDADDGDSASHQLSKVFKRLSNMSFVRIGTRDCTRVEKVTCPEMDGR